MEMAITLPATYQEAEAEAFAREKFACFKQEGSPWGGHSPLAPEATRVWFRQMLQIGLHGAANRMRIVAGAKAGDADYVALLKGVLLEAKSARRMDQLPTEIIDYDMWITAHGEQRMRRSEKRDYVIRDICVSLVVAALDDKFGIRPDRSFGSPPIRLRDRWRGTVRGRGGDGRQAAPEKELRRRLRRFGANTRTRCPPCRGGRRTGDPKMQHRNSGLLVGKTPSKELYIFFAQEGHNKSGSAPAGGGLVSETNKTVHLIGADLDLVLEQKPKRQRRTRKPRSHRHDD